jgi:hypothetical protein
LICELPVLHSNALLSSATNLLVADVIATALPTCRAFFAKVAAWEDELVDMLERQSAPVAIRNIVSVFKDRIHTERDKSEFKALCDKWTGVVEYPAGRWVACGW